MSRSVLFLYSIRYFPNYICIYSFSFCIMLGTFPTIYLSVYSILRNKDTLNLYPGRLFNIRNLSLYHKAYELIFHPKRMIVIPDDNSFKCQLFYLILQVLCTGFLSLCVLILYHRYITYFKLAST